MTKPNSNIVNHDAKREIVTGLPECVLAEPKRDEQLTEAILTATRANRSTLVTRIQEYQLPIIQNLSVSNNLAVKYDNYKRTAIIGDYLPTRSSPHQVGLLSAGTSDDSIVEETAFTLNYLGLGYVRFSDIGVAGIHRHQDAMKDINSELDIKCLIVVAGQDGALFPVISAQTKLPMIAVPTSIGYGLGGKGITALYSALQSCSPGVAVVNIDNGFGAACFAAKLLLQIK